MPRRSQTLLLVLAVALAAPVALAFETGLRTLLFPLIAPDFELARSFLEPVMTPIAWLLTAASTFAGLLGIALQGPLVRRRVAKLGEGATAARIEGIRGQVFFVTSTLPQLPTIVATFAFMFGASLVPTLASVAVCTLSVLVQGAMFAFARGGS